MRGISGTSSSIGMNPSVMGTGFFHKVEVMVYNVPCTINSDLSNLLIQYVR